MSLATFLEWPHVYKPVRPRGKMDVVGIHVPFATQVNNVGINTTRYLDINTDVYTRESVEAAKEKSYISRRDMLDNHTPITSVLQLPCCRFGEPRRAVFDCISQRIDIRSQRCR